MPTGAKFVIDYGVGHKKKNKKIGNSSGVTLSKPVCRWVGV